MKTRSLVGKSARKVTMIVQVNGFGSDDSTLSVFDEISEEMERMGRRNTSLGKIND